MFFGVSGKVGVRFSEDGDYAGLQSCRGGGGGNTETFGNVYIQWHSNITSEPNSKNIF